MSFSDPDRPFAPRTLGEAGLDWGPRLTSVAIERRRTVVRNRTIAILAIVGGLAAAGFSAVYDKFAARFAQQHGHVITASETAED